MNNYLDINYSAAAAAQSMSQLANTAAAAGLQYVTNKKLAEKQYEYNLDMWNRINEYNSPAAQMKRFEEAGLNPNLIYGQGNPGNAGTLEKPAPAAPDIQGAASELSKAFNILGLKKAIQEVRAAKADADMKTTAAAEAKDTRDALASFGELYSFDPTTGAWKFAQPDFAITRKPTLRERELQYVTGAYTSRSYHFNKLLEDQYRTLSLLPYRQALLKTQNRYLVPQASMAEYEDRYYPWSFWIGTGSKAVHGLAEGVGMFMPKNWVVPSKFNRPPIKYNNYYNY